MTSVQQYNVPQSYRDKILKWNGWGYSDSAFALNEHDEITFIGKRYDMCGKTMPDCRSWFEKYLGLSMDYRTPSQSRSELVAPDPIDNQAFIDYLRSNNISFSNAPQYRIVRSHGHTVHDIVRLRHGKLERIPDLVVWPRSEQDVSKIIEAANEYDVVIIPIGGGTSVSNALDCPLNEKRSICSLDMALMDKIIWIDETNLVCRAQAGIVGQSLERQLNAKGFTCGHIPDSVEFSTLGGWVSTRASGMKKNKYGNIEDLLVHVTMVTAKGVIQKQCQVPRISSGPDLHHVILGSEGTLGVITEVTIKIFPCPEVKKFGSFVFPTFDLGVDFFREVAKKQCQPASLRLIDNEQFRMGQALKVDEKSIWKSISSMIAKLYLTKWKNFNLNEMVAATVVYEGTAEEVASQEKQLTAIAEKYYGIPGGEENGKYGYRLTFAIAYLRDLAMEYGVIGESFETSVSWDKVKDLCANVKEVIRRVAKLNGVESPIASCRVTQVYDVGACVYFYLAFLYRGLENPLEVYDKIEVAARDEIIACGGSISHHHGVGKIRKQWFPQTVGTVGVSVLRALKNELDPKNVFANGNMIDVIPKSKL